MIIQFFWYRRIENPRITTLYSRTEMNMKKEGLRRGKMKWRKDMAKMLRIFRWTTKWMRILNKKIKGLRDTPHTTKNSLWCRLLWDSLACSTLSSTIINLYLSHESRRDNVWAIDFELVSIYDEQLKCYIEGRQTIVTAFNSQYIKSIIQFFE